MPTFAHSRPKRLEDRWHAFQTGDRPRPFEGCHQTAAVADAYAGANSQFLRFVTMRSNLRTRDAGVDSTVLSLWLGHETTQQTLSSARTIDIAARAVMSRRDIIKELS